MSSIVDYDVGQLLGRGGFASVYRARERSSGKEVAIKICEKARLISMNMMERMKNEIRIHYKLKHEHVVRFYGCFEDKINVYIVLELCNMGNMFRYLREQGPLPETVAVSIIKQLLSALQYIHQEGVVHRDLKLSNILLTRTHDTHSAGAAGACRTNEWHGFDGTTRSSDFIIKICDFGLAVQKEHPDEEHYTLCGTPNYIAPEVALQHNHGYPADVWSVGCLFYSMVVGSPPFEATAQAGTDASSNREDAMRLTLKRIISGEYEEPVGKMSTHAINFLRSLLHLDPSKRPNVRQILAHPLIRAVNGVQDGFHAAAHQSKQQHRMHAAKEQLSPVFENSRDTSKDSDATTAADACSSCGSSSRNHDLSTDTTDNNMHHSAYNHQPHRFQGLQTKDSDRYCVTHHQINSTQGEVQQQSVSQRNQHRRWGREQPQQRSRSDAPCEGPHQAFRLPVRSTEPVLRSPRQSPVSADAAEKSSHASRSTSRLNRTSLTSSWLTALQDMRQSCNGSSGPAAGEGIRIRSHATHEVQPAHTHSMRGLRVQSSNQSHPSYTHRSHGQMSASMDTTITADTAATEQCYDDCRDSMVSLSPVLLSSETDELLLLTKEKQLLFCTSIRSTSSAAPTRSYLRVIIDPRQGKQILIGRFEAAARDKLRPPSDQSSRYYLAEELIALKHFAQKGHHGADKHQLTMTHEMPPDVSELKLVTDRQRMKSIDFNHARMQRSGSNGEVPRTVQSLIRRIRTVLHSVQCQVPRQIIYFAFADAATKRTGGGSQVGGKAAGVMCKCMMMSNAPLPDFYVQWACGVRLRYELKSGLMTIERPADDARGWIALRWEGRIEFPLNHHRGAGGSHSVRSRSDVDVLVPEELSHYAHTAQRMLRKCLAEGDSSTQPGRQHDQKRDTLDAQRILPKVLTLEDE